MKYNIHTKSIVMDDKLPIYVGKYHNAVILNIIADNGTVFKFDHFATRYISAYKDIYYVQVYHGELVYGVPNQDIYKIENYKSTYITTISGVVPIILAHKNGFYLYKHDGNISSYNKQPDGTYIQYDFVIPSLTKIITNRNLKNIITNGNDIFNDGCVSMIRDKYDNIILSNNLETYVIDPNTFAVVCTYETKGFFVIGNDNEDNLVLTDNDTKLMFI